MQSRLPDPVQTTGTHGANRDTPTSNDAVVIPFPVAGRAAGPLSDREQRALELTAEGREVGEISELMSSSESTFLGEETVRSFQRCAVSKLAARSIAHAVAIALQRNLIRLDV